ncbi:OsmC family protein [Prevotella sp. MA2016]|uniref:OsmC family protein n=1 Tax=Prevotella sp. MA2016 TaxID=1408310 RepID=UPI0006876534|nr:OsmC family protein [Prevotella sp. MA2016]
MKKNQIVIITAALALQVSSAFAQGPLNIFKSAQQKAKLEQNAPSLRNHLKERKVALEAWKAIPASDLQPVTLTANVTAKNRSGVRELRIREFHYIGDCGYAHGGQDSGVDTPTTAQAVFASDLADSYLNQAALLGIDIDSLTIEIHGQPDKVKTNRVWYPRNFLYTIYIDSPASDAELEKLAVLAEQNSAVATLVKAAVVPQLTIDRKESPREKKIEGATLAGLREYIWGKRQALQASKAKAEAARAQQADKKAVRQVVAPKQGPWVKVFPNGVRQLTVNDKYLILHDNPAYLGGTDIGMTSIEGVLGILGTCITHISLGQAAERALDVDSISLTVQAEWDPRAGRKGYENLSIAPQNVRYTLHVLTPESEQAVKEWIEAVEKICPMYNLFKDTQTFEHRIVRGSFKRQ